MKKFTIASLPVYRWRYTLSYILIGATLAFLIGLAALYTPGGVTSEEIDKTLLVNTLTSIESVTPRTVIDLPHHALQKVSIELLGVTQLSIKLPSIILGALTSLALIVLLHRWFRSNVAILTAVIVITTGQLLFITQSGTSAILYLFWPSVILLFSTLIIQKARSAMLWYALLFISIALSLYSPLSLYIVTALLIAAVAHPKLRLSLRSLPFGALAAPFMLALVALIPLFVQIYTQPEILLTLLGIPATMPDILANAQLVLRQYFDFVTPSSGKVMTPVLGLGSLALIGLGFYTIFRSRYTIRSYTVISWLLLLLPIIVIQPDFLPVLFVPLMLVMAIGIDTLIREWYKLFPENPYARFAGLIPIGLLVVTLVATGVERFVFGYHYSPEISQNFSRDMRYVRETLDEHKTDTLLVVSSQEKALYDVMAAHPKTFAGIDVDVRIVSQQDAILASERQKVYTRAAHQAIPPSQPVDAIVVAPFTESADRFYVYKNEQK